MEKDSDGLLITSIEMVRVDSKVTFYYNYNRCIQIYDPILVWSPFNSHFKHYFAINLE